MHTSQIKPFVLSLSKHERLDLTCVHTVVVGWISVSRIHQADADKVDAAHAYPPYLLKRFLRASAENISLFRFVRLYAPRFPAHCGSDCRRSQSFFGEFQPHFVVSVHVHRYFAAAG